MKSALDIEFQVCSLDRRGQKSRYGLAQIAQASTCLVNTRY
jgi:hypothetical protein